MDQCQHVRGRPNVADAANDRGIFAHCFPRSASHVYAPPTYTHASVLPRKNADLMATPRLLGNFSRAILDYKWLRGSLFTSASSTLSTSRPTVRRGEI